MLYDKPWYRPGYFIGVLGACLYVDLRDPDSKAVKKLPLWQLFLFWAVQIVLFVRIYIYIYIPRSEISRL